MSVKPSTLIPIHSLKDRTDLGIEINYVHKKRPKHLPNIGVHRDDHYIFFLLMEGRAHMMLDFQEIHLKAANLACILPGQIHHPIGIFDATGWFLAIETSLIPAHHRELFEHHLPSQYIELSGPTYAWCLQNLESLGNYFKWTKEGQLPFNEELMRTSISLFTGHAADIFRQAAPHQNKADKRADVLVRSFKQLVATHFVELKKPTEYAGLLCISPAYLNEVVKQSTGFTVTYWIRNQIMLEAKRLLYYSDASIKEIASRLGYEDYAYFIRLFTQDTKLSPLQFRRKYHK